MAYDYPGSCAPSRWLPSAPKQKLERGPFGLAHRVPRASPMRAASGCLPPAVRIIPQYVPGFQPRIGACCQSRAIYYQQKPPSWHTKAHEISRSDELQSQQGTFRVGRRPAFVTGATMKPAGLAVARTRRPAKPGRGADAAATSRHQATHRGAGFVVARHSPAPAGVGLPEREARTPKGPQGAERSPSRTINNSLHPPSIAVSGGWSGGRWRGRREWRRQGRRQSRRTRPWR